MVGLVICDARNNREQFSGGQKLCVLYAGHVERVPQSSIMRIERVLHCIVRGMYVIGFVIVCFCRSALVDVVGCLLG